MRRRGLGWAWRISGERDCDREAPVWRVMLLSRRGRDRAVPSGDVALLLTPGRCQGWRWVSGAAGREEGGLRPWGDYAPHSLRTGEEMNPMHATFVTACVQVLQEGVADTLREPCVLGLAWLFADLGRVALAVPRMAAETFS